MGCFVSKDKLTKEDMDFLKTHTSYDETTIKEWYKGFKVNERDITAKSIILNSNGALMFCTLCIRSKIVLTEG